MRYTMCSAYNVCSALIKEAPLSSALRVRMFPYMAVAYILLLVQFVFLGLFVGALAIAAAPGVTVALGVGGVLTLATSIGCFLRLAAINRRGGGQGAGPIPHLIIPVESTEQIAEYEARYQHGPSADVAVLPERVAT